MRLLLLLPLRLFLLYRFVSLCLSLFVVVMNLLVVATFGSVKLVVDDDKAAVIS